MLRVVNKKEYYTNLCSSTSVQYRQFQPANSGSYVAGRLSQPLSNYVVDSLEEINFRPFDSVLHAPLLRKLLDSRLILSFI